MEFRKKDPMKLIESIDQLKDECILRKGDYTHFYIFFANGLARSSKRILYDEESDLFSIIHEIDESYQDDLTFERLGTETNILEAIEKKALYVSLI
jgi:hypothetical protein